MKCLCCGKEIANTAPLEEQQAGWHKRCVRKFFGCTHLPELDLSKEELEKLADASVSRGFTVPGVQKKLSLHLSSGKDARLTLVDYPNGYILKPPSEDYRALPEAEQASMHMADAMGIVTVPHALIRMKDTDQLAYITKRIDRDITSETTTKLYAMEDFCQLNYRLTQDKYRGSYEKCAKVIQHYSIHPGLDLSELFMRLLFSFVTGNSDMHYKNFSLIETQPGNREFTLSAAYDLLPVQVILPEDHEEFALAMNGKKRNLHRNDFLKFAAACQIPKASAEKMIRKTIRMEQKFVDICDNSRMPEDMKNFLKNLIFVRTKSLQE